MTELNAYWNNKTRRYK